MKAGILVAGFGVLVLCQLFRGEALQRLGIIGTPDASTIPVTQANLTTPGEDARDRRAALAKGSG